MNDNIDPSTIAPSPGIDPGQAPASPPASAESDSAASLNQPAVTSADIDNYKRGMYAAQQETATLRKRLRDVEPFVDEFQKNAPFRDYMYEKAREFGNESQGQVDPSVIRVLEPALQEARAARNEVAQWKYDRQMDDLALRFPDVMTADAKRELSIAAEASGNYDLEYHFIKQHGMSMVEKARREGQREAVRTIQDQNKLYVNSPTTTAIAPPLDISKMSPEQKQQWLNEELKRLDDPDYLLKVSRELSGQSGI